MTETKTQNQQETPPPPSDPLTLYARRGLAMWRQSRSRPGLPTFRLPEFPGLNPKAEAVRERINSLADAEDEEQAKIKAVTAELEEYRRQGRRDEVAKAFDAGTKMPEDRTAPMEAQIAESQRLIATYRRLQGERLPEVEVYLRAIPEAAFALRVEVEAKVKKEATALAKSLSVLGSDEMRRDLALLGWAETGGSVTPQPRATEIEEAVSDALRKVEAWIVQGWASRV